MKRKPSAILQVSTADVLGGAERVAWNLFNAYRRRGHASSLVVGRKRTSDPDVYALAHGTGCGPWRRFWWRLHRRLQPHYGRALGARELCRLAHGLAEPGRMLDIRRGLEDFRYPGTARLLEIPPAMPDVVHLHNLHGLYFDLRFLPALSRRVPTLLTLHDAWLLAGHCAHAFDCDRWETGCGRCPYLDTYPAVRRDATAENWRRKRDIFGRSRLYISTPCRWLMKRVERSILAPAIIEARVIPYGVDLAVFRPADRSIVRRRLGLSPSAIVLLVAAKGIRNNSFKDYRTIRQTVGIVAARSRDRDVVLVALGDDAPPERIGPAEIRFVPFADDPGQIAGYHQAADLYLHAARADTFPNSILEALACGTPVVATAVGGIPEQVRSFIPARDSGVESTPIEHATGALASPGDAMGLAGAIERIMSDDALRRRLSASAARDAQTRFDLDRQTLAYLEWYAEMIDEARKAVPAGESSEAERRAGAPKGDGAEMVSRFF